MPRTNYIVAILRKFPKAENQTLLWYGKNRALPSRTKALTGRAKFYCAHQAVFYRRRSVQNSALFFYSSLPITLQKLARGFYSCPGSTFTSADMSACFALFARHPNKYEKWTRNSVCWPILWFVLANFKCATIPEERILCLKKKRFVKVVDA